VNILAASIACAGLTLTATPGTAGPPETAQLTLVPSTWPSQLPAAHVATTVTDVSSFDTESWAVGTITNRSGLEARPSNAVVQHCVKAGCTAEFLPGLPETDGPKAEGIAGTSPSNLWAFGSWHSASNTESPLIWRNVTGAWRLFSTTGIMGDATVVDMTFGPSGETWATVLEDFDAGTWVLYRLVDSSWVQVNPIDAPVFPGPCQATSESWYDIVWADMEIVGGQPTLIGECREPVVLKRQGSAWRRIDTGLPTNAKWTNAAVVDKQLWVQGTLPDRSVVIYRRASGTWRQVSTAGITPDAQINDMGGTVTRNLWLVGETRPAGGTSDAAGWRWTGSTWRQGPIPAPSSAADWFTAVDARGYKPAWVVGTDSGLVSSKMGRVLREK
jgi:hypothetical protein